MHGLGNDFMVVDLISQRAYLDTATIQRLQTDTLVRGLISF